jgi:hypothetical protein
MLKNITTLAAVLIVTLLSIDRSLGDPRDNIKILHRPAKSESIPAIGNPMNINVELLNTTDVDANVRLIGSKDGRFIDITFPHGALNDFDRPVFELEIPSPVAAMSYQFVVKTQGSKGFTTSDRYILRRSCMQNFKVEVPDNEPNSAFRTEVSTMISQANLLERDTASLEASLKLIEELKSITAGN